MPNSSDDRNIPYGEDEHQLPLPRPLLHLDVTYGKRSVEVMPRQLATILAIQSAFLRMGLMFVGRHMEFAKQCVGDGS